MGIHSSVIPMRLRSPSESLFAPLLIKVFFFKVRGVGGGGIDPLQLKSHARQDCSFHCILCSQGEVYHVTVHVKLQHSLLAANGPF